MNKADNAHSLSSLFPLSENLSIRTMANYLNTTEEKKFY
jgi:hypothetical protein